MKRKAKQLKYSVINGAISANKFYKKARNAYTVGRTVYDKYKAGTKVIARAKRAIRKFTRTTRSRHYGDNGHNDWTALPSKTFYVGRRKPWKTLGNFHLEHTRDILLEQNATGYQNTGNGLSTFTNQQMYGNTSFAIANFDENWITDPFLLNPYSAPVTNPIYTRALGDTAAGDKYFIKNTVQRLQFVSLQPTPCKVEVYWGLCNVNSDRTPQLAWIDCVNAQEYGQTFLAEGAHTTSAATPTHVGWGSVSNPNTKPPKSFGHYWKILHKDQFMLQPGENQSMERTFVYNLMVNRNQIGDTQTMYLKGITLCPLIVVNGSVVGIGNDGEAFPPTNIDRVTYARTKVGFIHSCKMNFAALPVNRYDINRKEIGYIDGNTANATAIIDADDEEIAAQPIG